MSLEQATSDALERAAKAIAGARRVVALTGAGISSESGVPTFRGPGGLWRQFRPEDLANLQAFNRNPALVWEWYRWRRRRIAEARPNAGHECLARRNGAATIEINIEPTPLSDSMDIVQRGPSGVVLPALETRL